MHAQLEREDKDTRQRKSTFTNKCTYIYIRKYISLGINLLSFFSMI